MNEQADKHSLEDALMDQLRFGGFDKQNLAELVKLAASLHRNGIVKVRGFPLGKPPIVDGLRLSGDVELSKIGKLLTEILPKTPRFAGVWVFPKGIPWPEVYHVEVDLGSPIQAPRQRGF